MKQWSHTANMTQRFMPPEKSMSIMHKLSGPSLFGAAGLGWWGGGAHCDFRDTRCVAFPRICRERLDTDREYARHLVPRHYFKLMCVQQTGFHCCHIRELCRLIMAPKYLLDGIKNEMDLFMLMCGGLLFAK